MYHHLTDMYHSSIDPRDFHMSQYGRSMKRGKKLRIINNIKKLNEVFLELRECEGKGEEMMRMRDTRHEIKRDKKTKNEERMHVWVMLDRSRFVSHNAKN